MTKSTLRVPLGQDRVGDVGGRPRARCGPARSHSATRACTRSIAAPARAQRLDLGRATCASAARAAPRRRAAGAAPGSAARRRKHLLRPHLVVQRDRGRRRAEPSERHQRVRVVGLVPGDDLERRAPPTGEATRGRRARAPGTTSAGPRPAAATRQVSRSSGMRVVAGQVAQVGAGRDAAARRRRRRGRGLRARASRSATGDARRRPGHAPSARRTPGGLPTSGLAGSAVVTATRPADAAGLRVPVLPGVLRGARVDRRRPTARRSTRSAGFLDMIARLVTDRRPDAAGRLLGRGLAAGVPGRRRSRRTRRTGSADAGRRGPRRRCRTRSSPQVPVIIDVLAALGIARGRLPRATRPTTSSARSRHTPAGRSTSSPATATCSSWSTTPAAYGCSTPRPGRRERSR